jgi:hypothetical protein
MSRRPVEQRRGKHTIESNGAEETKMSEKREREREREIEREGPD